MFLLNDVFQISRYNNLPGFADATPDLIEAVLGEAHITINKNAIPKDPEKPMVTSGIRLGSPAMTTRGFKEADVLELANWIADVLDENLSDAAIAQVKGKATEICRRFPVYSN